MPPTSIEVTSPWTRRATDCGPNNPSSECLATGLSLRAWSLNSPATCRAIPSFTERVKNAGKTASAATIFELSGTFLSQDSVIRTYGADRPNRFAARLSVAAWRWRFPALMSCRHWAGITISRNRAAPKRRRTRRSWQRLRVSGRPPAPSGPRRSCAPAGLRCGLHGRPSVRHRRYSSAAMSASPLSASFRLCRCRGNSVSTTSRVGRTCASRRWPPIAMPSARLMTTCGCSAALPSGPRATSPSRETTSTC